MARSVGTDFLQGMGYFDRTLARIPPVLPAMHQRKPWNMFYTHARQQSRFGLTSTFQWASLPCHHFLFWSGFIMGAWIVPPLLLALLRELSSPSLVGDYAS